MLYVQIAGFVISGVQSIMCYCCLLYTSERRKTVAALVSERTGLESELMAVSEEIAGITGISGLSLTE